MDVKCSNNFIDVIEESVGRPLLRKELLRHPIKTVELEKLSVALNDFSRQYELPIKKDTELRPSISPKLEQINELGFNYVRRIHDTSQYTGGFTRALKKYLLYCHGLVIEDPLVYLLDYFRHGGANSPYALERLPAINSLLLEYSDISDLIRSNIVFPVSEPLYADNDVPYPEESLLKELRLRLSDKSENLSQLAEFIYRENFRKQQFSDNIDSFYPSHEYVDVLKEIMIIQNDKFTRDEIITTFGTNVIGNVSLLNLEDVSIEDICFMRKEDELFSEWRGFLNSTFGNLYANSSDYTDLDKEFLADTRNEFSNLETKVNSRLRKSLSTFSLKDAGRSISIGVISGAVTGIATGDLKTAFVTTLLSGGIEPSIEVAIDLVKNRSRRKEKKVIKNHFLALGLPS
ncbi:hypothetical protein ACJ6TS_00495 [Citrobacter telavivensis]